MRSKMVMAVCIAASMVSWSQAEEPEVVLDKIVVTPNGYGQAINKVSSSVTVITPNQINCSNADKVVDMLKPVPGVTVRDLYGNGAAAVVDIAGFGGQAALNVLVLVDGRKVNDVDMSGVDWSQIPLDQVERIEVIRGGSGGVLYGDNASSGVINIITKKGSGKPKVDLQMHYGSYNMNAQKISLGGSQDDKMSYWLSAGRQSTNGYRHNSFNKTGDFSSKLEYKLSDLSVLRFNSGFHAATYGMPGALWQINLDREGRRFARYGKDHANDKDFYFVLGNKSDFGDFGSLDIDLTYRNKNIDSYFLTSGNPTQKNRIRTLGIAPKYTLDNSIVGHKNKLISGLDYSLALFSSDTYTVASNALLTLTGTHKNSLAGYFQDEFSIFEPLIMIGGFRYEAQRDVFSYHDNDTTSWGHPNPEQDTKIHQVMRAFNTGLVYAYRDDSSVFFNAGRSYRFPEVNEFTYNDASWQQQLDTTLKPQDSLNYQIGIRHTFYDKLKGSLSFYRMKVKNELYYNSIGGPVAAGKNENYDKTIHQGMEFSLESKLTSRVSFTGNYAFTRAFLDGGQFDENDIPAVPRHKINLGLKFVLPKNLVLNLSGNYVGKRYFLNDEANAQSRLNGYMTADTNLSWRNKGLTLTLGINNLFNKRYAEFGGYAFNGQILANDKFYYPSPERNFNLKAEYSF